ncbi:hypothetical protein [uncultured Sphingomonas sp.]|uniref:hypothetical protein n=1 Tax=uncultured Sphingomonas sp. TaxID=158754 RepID=UPI0035CAE757
MTKPALGPTLDDVTARLWETAEPIDAAACYPSAEIALLGEAGLLAAALPDGPLLAHNDHLRDTLMRIGAASLPVGRLYEGHVNAATLVRTYGAGGPAAILADEAAHGRISAVWNAERGDGPVATRISGGWTIAGRKVHCSGAGSVRRPVVTARIAEAGDAPALMLLPDMTAPGVASDLAVWRASGMRATATGTVMFDGVFVADDAVIGEPGDYYRSPLFSGGAWRVLAVQLGGLQRILALHADALIRSGRERDPVFRARFAAAAGGFELARLSVAEAARRAQVSEDPAAIDAYVDGARGQFETLALAGVDAARRNVGLRSFIAPDPLDRVVRDLETYLRQPFLDASRDAAAGYLLPRAGCYPS